MLVVTGHGGLTPVRDEAPMVEQRRFPRSALYVSVEFTLRDSWETGAGIGKDISLGGMYIETDVPAPFGTALLVRVRFPGERAEVVLPAVVRWTKKDGMGLQFSSLGARETHVITEIGKKTWG